MNTIMRGFALLVGALVLSGCATQAPLVVQKNPNTSVYVDQNSEELLNASKKVLQDAGLVVVFHDDNDDDNLLLADRYLYVKTSQFAKGASWIDHWAITTENSKDGTELTVRIARQRNTKGLPELTVPVWWKAPYTYFFSQLNHELKLADSALKCGELTYDFGGVRTNTSVVCTYKN